MVSWVTVLAALAIFGIAVWVLVFMPVVGLVVAALVVLALFTLSGLASTVANAWAEHREAPGGPGRAPERRGPPESRPPRSPHP